VDETYTLQHVDVSAGSYAVIVVSDTGSGIPADVLPHIFEPFFTTKEMGKGTGLGLSTAFGIVKQSGGAIWTYTEPGLGTTFKVYLPCTGEMPEHLASRAAATTPKSCETVLLVEDEPSLLKMTEGMLLRQGHRVLTASDGAKALALIESYDGSIDLLVTDVVMPKMNGVQLAKAFQALRPRARVLYMSGYTDMAVRDETVIPSSFTFLEKPFTAVGLAVKVQEALSRLDETHSRRLAQGG
jgi:two-component system cell cycle sensor histidine kinase/response regulator CckA